ncbi:hypothetical protein ABN154_18380 [Klebsiella michiganensis]|uniref:hypothetical protein n=1 Tax=Klebsiella michiganensis TaxID=1134687 RepID=UPI0032DB58C0
MLNKETTTILYQYNNEDGIAHVITKSLIRYYSVNGFYGENVELSYLNYLKTIFADREFHFLDTEKLLSYRDQIFTTVMEVVQEDLAGKTGAEEFYQSSQWQPEALESILTVLFDNKLILTILSQ